MSLTVTTTIDAPIEAVWAAWTSPEDIKAWNAASDDWHTTEAEVDLRPGGAFRSRMEAMDGSVGFDFEGTYTRVEAPHILEAVFGGRALSVRFVQSSQGVVVEETFEPEDTHLIEMQRQGWQAILDNFARHVVAKSSG